MAVKVLDAEDVELADENLQIDPDQFIGDLSNGGSVNGVVLTPMRDGKAVMTARANAIRAWRWDGAESTLPLGWNTRGTKHNGARPYFLKRLCLCCRAGGFVKARCPVCVRSSCTRCQGGTKQGQLIPVYYAREEDVPYPTKFYGEIPCFLETCSRQGTMGFKSEQGMRMHGRSRHRVEYQVWQEVKAASRSDELETMRQQIAALMAAQVQGAAAPSQPIAVAAAQTIAPPSQPQPTAHKSGMSPERRAAFKQRMVAGREKAELKRVEAAEAARAAAKMTPNDPTVTKTAEGAV